MKLNNYTLKNYEIQISTLLIPSFFKDNIIFKHILSNNLIIGVSFNYTDFRNNSITYTIQ